MIKKIFSISILLFVSIWLVSARTVEYDFYMTDYVFKDYQQFWKIETNNDNISIKDVNYILDTNFDWDTIIPKYTSLEKKIIDRFWFEDINKIVNSSYIKIWWSKYRFQKPLVNWTFPKHRFNNIKLEEKEVLNTNLKHNRVIRINSEKDQSIKLRLYSVSPDTYNVEVWVSELTYPWNHLVPDRNTVITLYDTTQEFYNVSWHIVNNMVPLWDWNKVSDEYLLKRNNITDLKIEKKYKLIEFKRKNQYNEDWISKSYIPYYEISFDVSKWANDLYLNYESYQFPNEPLQIK